eukprot:gene10874-16996_t
MDQMRTEAVERVSVQPKGRSYSRRLIVRGTDEQYHMMTRGKLMDRIRVALAGSISARVVLGEETNFGMADVKRAYRMAQKMIYYYDVKRAYRMAQKMIYYYGMSTHLGITTWARQPYSQDFALGQSRPRKVVSTDAMDEYADWPTIREDFRFDPPDPSDVTWHRYQDKVRTLMKECYEEYPTPHPCIDAGTETRYQDEVRKLMKECYEEVWGMLEERRDAVLAGVKEKEMLGGELRAVFDQHPPRSVPADRMPKLEMTIFTKGDGTDRWPYGMDWLDDAYPKPYWVQKQEEEDKAAKEAVGATKE